MVNEQFGILDVGRIEYGDPLASKNNLGSNFNSLKYIMAQEIDEQIEGDQTIKEENPEIDSPIKRMADLIFGGDEDIAKGYWDMYRVGWYQQSEGLKTVLTQNKDSLKNIFQGGNNLQIINGMDVLIAELNYLTETLNSIHSLPPELIEKMEMESV